MGENICKWCNQQGLKFQNVQTAQAIQQQKDNPKSVRIMGFPGSGMVKNPPWGFLMQDIWVGVLKFALLKIFPASKDAISSEKATNELGENICKSCVW